MDIVEGKELMRPVNADGIKLFSIGFLSKPDEAIVWRGPMVSQAVRQFMNGVNWGSLDYLIVDLPPGTGDVQLTIVQNLPLSGAVIVCTPQKLAMADAARACSMFTMQAVNIPILGVVENMSWYSPPDKTEEKYYIFGHGNTAKLAGQFNTEMLGSLPLDNKLNQDERSEALFNKGNIAYFTDIAGLLVRQIAVKSNKG
jgi:ATP-binding protein involved in chromosome partitioning